METDENECSDRLKALTVRPTHLRTTAAHGCKYTCRYFWAHLHSIKQAVNCPNSLGNFCFHALMQRMSDAHLISGRCMKTSPQPYTEFFIWRAPSDRCLGSRVEGNMSRALMWGWWGWAELCLWAGGILKAPWTSRMKSQGQFLVLKNWGTAWYRDGFYGRCGGCELVLFG